MLGCNGPFEVSQASLRGISCIMRRDAGRAPPSQGKSQRRRANAHVARRRTRGPTEQPARFTSARREATEQRAPERPSREDADGSPATPTRREPPRKRSSAWCGEPRARDDRRWQVRARATRHRGHDRAGLRGRGHRSQVVACCSMLRAEHAQNAELVRRFRREASGVANVAHPNLTTVFDVGRRSDGTLYVVQEMVDGPTLDDVRVQRGRLDEREAVSIVHAVASALAAAHASGFVHRDVRPANVVLARAPFTEITPKLLGFRGTRLGGDKRGREPARAELRYRAPEIVEAAKNAAARIDGRADVWSLGVVFYELLTGSCPFDGPTAVAIEDAIRRGFVPKLADRAPGVGADLVTAVERALVVEAQRRPAMRAWVEELARLGSRGERPALLIRDERSRDRAAPIEAGTDNFELEDDDIEEIAVAEVPPSAEDNAPTRTAVRPPPATEAEDTGPSTWDWMRGTNEVESDFARPSLLDVADRCADAAQRALRMNALAEAVSQAESGLVAGDASGELVGQLHLVRTIASFWLGRFEDTARAAELTMQSASRGTAPWYAAVGHLALARAATGHAPDDKILESPDMAGGPRASQAQTIAVCRVATAMIDVGKLADARRAVRLTKDHLERGASSDPTLLAWLDVAFAARAAFVGDLPRELPRRTSAIERFTASGDVRNACEQRAHLGGVLVSLGAYEDGERVLHEALGIADPMRLHLAHGIKARLAFAAFRQGEGQRALSLANDALVGLRGSGDRRTLASVHTVLALTHALLDEPKKALASADAAVEAAVPFPSQLAHALAVRAATLLSAGDATNALEPATRAMKLLEEHGGAGDGESLVRLSFALALGRQPSNTDVHRVLKDARERVFALAERLGDPHRKRVFLERVPENARLLQLAGEWPLERAPGRT
ncbi:MAG: protein kinase [Polyangiaceae bacterium]